MEERHGSQLSAAGKARRPPYCPEAPGERKGSRGADRGMDRAAGPENLVLPQRTCNAPESTEIQSEKARVSGAGGILPGGLCGP
ncbi:hypothetical protein NDU88_003288 [Pleurodeles waltl]|uniref:Uncharacterized protein n=1 Tax=Pleurodeles waltl TaxID=8319 RepID=A0AAV7PCN5_PLEWA|nr:hypothetical protein NDU88_003288 [Pleurodeles waltl]